MFITRRTLALIGAFLLAGIISALVLWLPTAQPAGSATIAQIENVDNGLVLPLKTLDGQWKADKNGTVFTAVVAGDSIAIELGSDDTSLKYWLGTFESLSSAGDTITSHATPTDEIVLSGDSAKDFQVGTDDLTFTFQALGAKTKVVLHRV